MKKFVSIVLTLVLVLGIAIPASASQITIGTIETEEQKLARVQAEVLSGNITNEQDVIEVALAQYAEKVAYCRANGIEIDPNESLTITQVIESDASVAGVDSVQDVAITGLLLVDDGVQLTANNIIDDSYSKTIGISGGNIVATTTMTVRMNVIGEYPFQSYSTRVYKLSTTFQNFAGQTADKIQHFCQLINGHYDNPLYASSVVTNPASSVPITFYPSTSFIDAGGGPGAYYMGETDITENGTVYRIFIKYFVQTGDFE